MKTNKPDIELTYAERIAIVRKNKKKYKKNERYRTDPEYRQLVKQRALQYYKEHRQQILDNKRKCNSMSV